MSEEKACEIFDYLREKIPALDAYEDTEVDDFVRGIQAILGRSPAQVEGLREAMARVKEAAATWASIKDGTPVKLVPSQIRAFGQDLLLVLSSGVVKGEHG